MQFYQDYNALEKQLHHSYPTDVSFKNSLAISYSKLGETHAALGHLEQALQFYQDYNALEKQLHHSYPTDVSFKNSLAISYSKLGETHAALGHLEQALQLYQDYNALEKQLHHSYPTNVEFKNNLAISYAKLGQYYQQHLNDNARAIDYFQHAEDLWLELVRDAPRQVQFQRFLAMIQEELADLG